MQTDCGNMVHSSFRNAINMEVGKLELKEGLVSLEK